MTLLVRNWKQRRQNMKLSAIEALGYVCEEVDISSIDSANVDKIMNALIQNLIKAFENPTKPIGSFYSKQDADRIAAETGYTFVEDAGRGYRRVVPSPKPVSIVELKTVETLLNEGTIVITVGGGGIPVIKNTAYFEGVAAVIDKDRASAKLALDLKADMLVILTAVDKVSLNFNRPDQIDLDEMSLEEAEKCIQEGQFAKGSMLPKVESCIEYVSHTPDGKALITSLEKAKEALQGKTGTIIHR